MYLSFLIQEPAYGHGMLLFAGSKVFCEVHSQVSTVQRAVSFFDRRYIYRRQFDCSSSRG